MDLSPFVRQTVKTQNSANGIKMPFNGGLSHGFVSTAVYEGVQAGSDPAVGEGGVARGGGAGGLRENPRGPPLAAGVSPRARQCVSGPGETALGGGPGRATGAQDWPAGAGD